VDGSRWSRRRNRRALLPLLVGLAVVASAVPGGIAGAEPDNTSDLLPASCAGVSQLSIDDLHKRYPTFQTDQLEIVYLDACALENIWIDKGTASSRELGLWRLAPFLRKAFPGFRSPGAMPVTAPDYKIADPRQAATFLVRDRSEKQDRIARPTALTDIYGTAGSGSAEDVHIYEVQCPQDFVALGDYALTAEAAEKGNGVQNLMGDALCIDKGLTYQLEPIKDVEGKGRNGAIWSSGKGRDLGVFGVQRPAKVSPGPNTVVIAPPTFWSKKDSYDVPPTENFRGLKVPLKTPSIQSAPVEGPKLPGPSLDGFEAANPATTVDYEISAFVVKDDFYDNDLAKLLDSPTYNVHRTTRWEPVGDTVTCAPDVGVKGCGFSRSIEKSESETHTWNNVVGGALTGESEVEFGGQPLGIGVKTTFHLSLELNYSHEDGGQLTKTTAVNDTNSTDLAPGLHGVFAARFQPTSTYEIYRKNDKSLNERNRVNQPYTAATGSAVVKTYPLAKVSQCGVEGSDAGGDDCELPSTSLDNISEQTPIYSEDGEYYLFLSDSKSLEVREKGAGIDQEDAFLWSLDTIHKHGQFDHPITNVSFKDGQLIVSAVGLADWVSQPKTYDGARLAIDDKGNLVIEKPRGKKWDTVWNSKYDKLQKGEN